MTKARHHVRNVGTAAIRALPGNPNRKVMVITNKHGTQAATVKLGSTFVASDVVEVQKISFSEVPTAGSFKVRWNGNDSAALAHTADASAVQTAIQAVSGLGSATVTGTYGTGFTVTMTAVALNGDPDLPLLEVVENTLNIAEVDEVQTVSFTSVPTSGSFKLGFAGAETPSIAFDDDAAAVQVALRTISQLAAVTVSGDFSSGFDVTFAGVLVSGDQPLLTVVESDLQVDEVQSITFSAVPDEGAFTLGYGEEETAAIAFDDDAAAVQVALRALTGLENVTVAGDFSAGFDVTFAGVVGDADLLTEESNTLEESATPVVITIEEDTAGEITDVSVAQDTVGAHRQDISTTVVETVKGAYVDGLSIAAGAQMLLSPAPIDEVWLKAAGANTRIEILEGEF